MVNIKMNINDGWFDGGLNLGYSTTFDTNQATENNKKLEMPDLDRRRIIQLLHLLSENKSADQLCAFIFACTYCVCFLMQWLKYKMDT